MKSCLLSCLSVVSLLFFLPSAVAAQFERTPSVQVDILRVAPDDAAAFVPMVMPLGGGGAPKVEVLSRQGAWEEVRLHYRFKYNNSINPHGCAMSLF